MLPEEDFFVLKGEVCREEAISNDFGDIIMNFIEVQTVDIPEFQKFCGQFLSDGFFGFYVRRAEYNTYIDPSFSFLVMPKCFGLQSKQALAASGILRLQNQPVLQLKGSGVLIGLIDTGIDYQNKVFQNEDGTTRITRIWDQTIQSGLPPDGMIFGTEYTREQINEALRSEDPLSVVPSVDEIGHGTFMAGIAAGSENLEADFIGAAPEAEIAVVKMKQAKDYLRDYYFIPKDVPAYQENDIMIGLRYLDELAESLGKPLVICLGIGTNNGDHTGNSPLGESLDFYARKIGRSICIGVGNEGNSGHHYFGRVDAVNEFENVEIRVGEGSIGFTLELWGQLPDLFTVGVRSPGGEIIPRIPVRKGQINRFPLVFENTVITVDYRIAEDWSGAELIFMRFAFPTQGIWTLQIYDTEYVTGEFHMWLPITQFLSAETYFLRANPDTTITEPSTIMSIVSVTSYDVRNNSISATSGRGFTRVGSIKPDAGEIIGLKRLKICWTNAESYCKINSRIVV